MKPAFDDGGVQIYHGDSWELASQLEPQSINTIVTSPPYWGLRDYGEIGQFGLESTPDEYVEKLVELFRRLKPSLRDDGTVWLNIGDSYAGNNSRASNNGRAGFGAKREGVFTKTGEGLKTKDLVGIPWRVAFALQADGWYLRQDIIWHKPNPLPESVTDRCTKSHEYIFLLSKSPKYYFDSDAIKEDSVSGQGTRNKRSVWSVSVKTFKGAHFAVFPPDLIEPCILAGCPEGGTVLDPFMGSGTTAQVARKHGRKSIGFELNADYIEIAEKVRLAQGVLL